MIDALQELSYLSEALQHHDVGVEFVNKKLKITTSLLEIRILVPETYYSMTENAV